MNEHSLNDFFIEYIHRCRRRVLVIMLINVAVWWTTVAVAGMVLSRVLKLDVLMPALFIAGSIVFYCLWKSLPGNERIVKIIDQSLSLKEGLITAFQYKESNEPYVRPLIRQITPRLNVSKPSQLFPLLVPKVILIWPFVLIVLMLYPGSGGFWLTGSIKGESGSLPSAKDNANESAHRNDNESLVSSVSKGMETHSQEYTLQKSIDDRQHTGGDDRIAPAGKERRLSVEKKDPTGFRSALQENSRPEGGQLAGRGTDSNKNNSESAGSKTISSVSGLAAIKDSSAGKKVVVTGMGIAGMAKDRLTTGSAESNDKWDGGQWKASYKDALQVLIQQDIPDDYKTYVRSYFDSVQKEEGPYGRH